MHKKSQSELRRIQELRRSNAATPISSRKKYTRQSNKKMIELAKKEKE